MHALSVTQCPTGRWLFVGRVPTLLGYENAEDVEMALIICQVGLTMAQKIAAKRGLPIPRNRTWESREAAVAEAAANGFRVE